MVSNDDVERRRVATTTNEAVLSKSSTYSFAHRRRHPRSLEPIVSWFTAVHSFANAKSNMEPQSRIPTKMEMDIPKTRHQDSDVHPEMRRRDISESKAPAAYKR
jgi:hypothetical protein